MLHMGISKVNWKKYLNSSNPTINTYLNSFQVCMIVENGIVLL